MDASIYSWIGTLSPEFPIASLLSARIDQLLQALSALLLKVLNSIWLNPE